MKVSLWPRRATAAIAVAAFAVALTTVVGVAPAHAATYSGSIPAGTTLYSGDKVSSPSGQFSLLMQSDGNLVLYSYGNQPLWHTHTNGNPGARAVFQTDGNILVVSQNNQPLWGSWTQNNVADRLYVQNDGNMVWFAQNGTLLYTSGVVLDRIKADELFLPGHSFQRYGYRAIMQPDGNLVIYRNADSAVMWSTSTYGHPGAYAHLQTDGNLVIYDGGQAIWASGTQGQGAGYFSLRPESYLAVYRVNGSQSWGSDSGPVAPVPSNVQAAAQEILAYGPAVRAWEDPNLTAPAVGWIQQIQALANGAPANSGCYVDLRVLQTLLILLDRYGSVTINSLNRYCASGTHFTVICGNSTAGSHCKPISSGLDLGFIGGQQVNGWNTRSIEALNHLHARMPQNTQVGQSNCRAEHNVAQSWPRYIQESDGCNHIHIDFQDTSGQVN